MLALASYDAEIPRTSKRTSPRHPLATRTALALLAVAALLLAGCGSDSDGAAGTSSTTAAEGAETTAADLSGEITVSAAASLTESFTVLGQAFEAANPDTTVTFTFDSSATLAGQILEGAPVDVYASADEANTTKLTDEELVAGSPTPFARNELVIVTKPGNPEGIEDLADLVDSGVISLCGEEVPCGKFATQVLEHAEVTIDEGDVTRGQNVKASLTAVTEGDAVAGIVYATDAEAAGDAVDTVIIPADDNAIATYPVSVLREASNAEVAEAFRDFVVSAEGLAILEEYGFLSPA